MTEVSHPRLGITSVKTDKDFLIPVNLQKIPKKASNYFTDASVPLIYIVQLQLIKYMPRK